MSNDERNLNAYFFQLVYGLQMAAMQQMGKIASPITGKMERNLEAARSSIDMLSMLEEKTRNNLTKEESELLKNILFELRMNFVDESKKSEESDTAKDVKGEEKKEEKTEQKSEEKKGSSEELKRNQEEAKLRDESEGGKKGE